MAGNSTIATRFPVLLDTHNFEFTADTSQPLKLPTPKADVLLHCGDLTEVGGISSFKRALKMLGSIDAELKLVIPGNHDLELDKAFWEAQRDEEGNAEDPEDHDPAIKAMTGPLAADAGVIYLTEGTHSFTLKTGAKFSIYVSPYTPAFGNWAFAYKHNEDRFNSPQQTANGITSIATDPIPDDIDIVMTHGPPRGILDWCPQGNVGCSNLVQAVRRVKPLMHCFGHIHEGHGVEAVDWKKKQQSVAERPPRKNEVIRRFFENDPIENPYPQPFVWKDGRGGRTLAVNASIMTRDYKPENAPWLISLNLPRSS
ncbi:hypothetical protein JMJ35_004507 [Cladonia borealis]|uniref:Calcineurin-like phosphoesterase domain-containing protein n=1 Tax=Cladonia borealis TaxID=184061 RepID=A0AA39UBJ9_9LECA|nr:hypothetical protein JMJ35_004507 [Cladonia borealis]